VEPQFGELSPQAQTIWKSLDFPEVRPAAMWSAGPLLVPAAGLVTTAVLPAAE